jgi:RNA polymerase sigma-70 factor (ECF subfamily)
MSDDLDRHQLQPLLERVIAGDRTALNELFGRLRPYLHSLVRKTLGPDWKDASDIVQSSLRRINENFDNLLGDDPTVPHLLAWIKKIVRNRAIDEARRRASGPATGNDSALVNVAGPTDPEQAAARDQRAVGVMAALHRLPQRQRQVVELHYFDRLKDAEISARLGGSVAAIRVLRCRALKELRRLMENDHDAE